MVRRKVKVVCKNCNLAQLEGFYTEVEWNDLKEVLKITKTTTCCGNFQHGAFPIQEIYPSQSDTPANGPLGELKILKIANK